MKKQLLSLVFGLISVIAMSQERPLWMRYPTISPDGTAIAFTYRGDIFTVSVNGGNAYRITSNSAYDTNPIWSPDSKKILFASDRMGSLDLFIVNKEGGNPTRLTTFSGKETPLAFADNDHVLFLSYIMPSAEDAEFPSRTFCQVYEVGIQGGRPKMFSSMPMDYISFSKNGKQLLYTDKKGYEDPWRKHEQASISRNVWSYTPSTGKYDQLTHFKGEDRNAVWASDQQSFYYLSERNGSFNVFKKKTGGQDTPQQITNFTTNPVRFLSIADNQKLCFGYDGEIYTLKQGDKPQKVQIHILADTSDRQLIREIKTSGVSDIAVSPKGDEIAFILRGDVYVTSVDYKTTKHITNTPEQERDLSFSPDGKSLLYSSERNGLWQVYQASIVRKDEKQFTYATDIKEERLTKSDSPCFQATYSPDGKEIAYLENRSTIKVMNLKSRAVRTIMEGKYEYSYIDGDQWYQWSPDSKWILTEYIGIGGWNNSDVALFNADGKGKMYNLTESGYSDTDPKWVLDGKAMIWSSDRAGYRNHGSWGAEQDVYITFFDSDAYDKFLMSKEDLARLDAIEKDKKDKGKDKKSKNDKSDKSKDSDEDSIKVVEPLKFDITNHRDRVVRLTVNSSFLGDYVLTPKGDKLYYLATFEKDADLWVHDFKKDNTHIVLKNVGDGHLIMDKKGNNIFICTHGAIKKIDLSKKDNAAAAKNIDFEADLDYRPYKERAYMFDHIWRQMKDKFYRVDMNGVNWKSYRKIYEKFLPYINNNYDFTEMLSEMLGELNASHTGARYYPSNKGLLTTAALGVFYDDSYQGDGLRIKEILDKGPFTLTPNKVKVGCIINKIDGQEIKKGEDYFPLFEGKVGKKVLLSVYNPSTKQYLEATVKAISYSAQVDLLYKRWVDRRRATVDSLSGGKIGYVHIKSMDSQSFRTMYSELLGRCRNKEAMIVDERHNGGGWLHDDVATLLSGKEYVKYVPRGQFIGSDPYNKWVKPSCMLICEDDYSNAHGTPWVYKTLGVGKLIGSPVPGTMTAVWWESQIDKSVVFGIPEVGCIDNSGHYLENTELEPDILIYNDPASVLKGEDKQLEKAVKVMMKK